MWIKTVFNQLHALSSTQHSPAPSVLSCHLEEAHIPQRQPVPHRSTPILLRTKHGFPDPGLAHIPPLIHSFLRPPRPLSRCRRSLRPRAAGKGLKSGELGPIVVRRDRRHKSCPTRETGERTGDIGDLITRTTTFDGLHAYPYKYMRHKAQPS